MHRLASALVIAAIAGGSATARAESCPHGSHVQSTWHGNLIEPTDIAYAASAGTYLVRWDHGATTGALRARGELEPSSVIQDRFAPEPDVLAGGNDSFLAVGKSSDGSGWVGRRLDLEGKLLSAFSIAALPPGAPDLPAIAWDGHAFLVTWSAPSTSSGWDVHLARVTEAGVVSPPVVVGHATTRAAPNVHAIRAGAATWVAWDTERKDPATDQAIRSTIGVRLDDADQLLDATPVVISELAGPVAMASLGDTALILVQSGPSTSDIFMDAHVLDAHGLVSRGMASGEGTQPFGLIAIPSRQTYALWTTVPHADEFPVPATAVSVREIDAHGQQASTVHTIPSTARAIVAGGDRGLVAVGVASQVSGTIGTESIVARAVDAALTPQGEHVIDESPFLREDLTVCDDDGAGMNAGCDPGPSANGSLVAGVAIAFTLRRRRAPKRC